MNIKVEKRLPFGFTGEWGRVYKLYTFDEESGDIIWQNKNYVQIDSDVQFKYLENGVDKSLGTSQPVINLPTTSANRVVKTTDAYFNKKSKNFECVVGLNDIVYVFGCFWLVETMEERSIFTPNKQTFYYCALKRIFDEVIRRNDVKN